MSIKDTEATDILRLVAGVLHLGNIHFIEKGNYSQVADKDCKEVYIEFN
jgi:myosin heavy subunit